MIYVDTTDGEKILINTDTIIWLDPSKREVQWGTAYVRLTKKSFMNLEQYLTEQTVEPTQLPAPRQTRRVKTA